MFYDVVFFKVGHKGMDRGLSIVPVHTLNGILDNKSAIFREITYYYALP